MWWLIVDQQVSDADRQRLLQLCLVLHLHDHFEAGSLMVAMVSQGWPRILADLKTLLETGETLPAGPAELAPTVRLGLTKSAKKTEVTT